MTLQRRQVWIGIGIVVLLPILVPLIAVPGAKTRILRSLNAGLGRPIRADAVHLRLFPLPGVELDGVRLADDPAFGLEDMVVAEDATAAVRLDSLLTGQLSFARIHLDRASINLVRNRAGQWNIAALLDRATRAGGASSGHALAPSRRFPYIEWSDSRVNFKLEQTKQRFYLDQVQGSLARDGAGWRLQARFQPQRTDLNLSDTGDVAVDGRWPVAASNPGAAAGFSSRPFDLVLRLSNSYLAGSSALVAAHDAGVHGILAAQVHIRGRGRDFEITGALQAQALRRWDLLPPPASVSCSFAGAYDPAQDRFTLLGAGDPGFHHLRLQGEVDDLFSSPTADLSLTLQHFAASDLLPLALAVKAHLPADLHADGVVDGLAQLHWSPAAPQGLALQGNARFSLAHLLLATGSERLDLPSADLGWNGRELRLPPTAATLSSGAGQPPVPLRLAAAVDRSGFLFQLDSPAFTDSDTGDLALLLGVRSPWPSAVHGSARLRLQLASPWSSFRQAHWTGQAVLQQALFQPSSPDDSGGLALHQVEVSFAQPLRLSFAIALPGDSDLPPDLVRGALEWSAGAVPPLRFDLRAPRLRSASVWRLLHPPPANLVQRVVGDVAGDLTGDITSPLAPAWMGHLHAAGQVAVDDLDWHGIHAGVFMTLEAAPGHWQATSLALALAQGRFIGAGRFDDRGYRIAGAVAPSQSLRLVPLLDPTPYRGLLSGALSGSLQLARPVGAIDMGAIDAQGEFDLRHGSLATAAGPRAFDRFTGAYRLRQGVATFTRLLWVASGERWRGQGTATFASTGTGTFLFQLDDRDRLLRLSGPLRPPQ